MLFKPIYAFALLLVNVLAAVVTSSARSTGLVKLTDRRDERDRPVYLWTIGQDEQDRLSALLEADFYDTGVAGTYVTAPPQVCPHCGKETEFIDWVYTALERGVHSPGFIFDSLKAGHTPKGVHHDVYCSVCGHLTHIRDVSGNEGGARHISHATPYDRASRTFGKRAEQMETRDTVRREDLSESKVDGMTEASAESAPAGAPAEGAFWVRLGSWVSKREDSDASDREVKVEVEARGPAEAAPPTPEIQNAWLPGRWIVKREDEGSLASPTEDTPGWDGPKWLARREEEGSLVSPTESTSDISEKQNGWIGRWDLRREVAS